jgi:hypothetical protein
MDGLIGVVMMDGDDGLGKQAYQQEAAKGINHEP